MGRAKGGTNVTHSKNRINNNTWHLPTLFSAPSDSYDNKTITAAENLDMYTIL